MNDIFTYLAAFSAGIAAVSIFLLLADLFHSIRIDAEALPADENERKKLPLFFRLFLPLTTSLMPFVRIPFLKDTVSATDERISMAGYALTITGERFLALRLLLAALGIVLALLLFAAHQPAGALLFLLLFCLYPGNWLSAKIRKRHTSILRALPNVLDLLTLSVEAGKDFLTALRDISNRRKADDLGEEFLRTLHEIQLGKPRQTALREMAQRVRQNDLTSVIQAIIQADELGVSIGQLLRIQGDQLRVKRFARAEKLANEAPVKILFPVVIFIFPSVFLILMSPILMQAMRTLFGS